MKNIILVLSLLMTISAWSQELPFIFKGRVENSDIGAGEGGVTVGIVQNGSSVFSTASSSNGKYTLRGNIDYSQAFDVVFSKAGLVSKRVHFDLSDMNEEDIPPGEVRPVEKLDISMFKIRENVDFSFLDTEPVASFDWNTRAMSAKNDAVASEKMRARINALLLDEVKNKAKLEADYAEAIFQAKSAYDEENYEKSLEKYKEASSLKPAEAEPKAKIIELEALLKAQQEADAAKKAAEEAYDNLISEADDLRDDGNLKAALPKYQEAAAITEEVYPDDQILLLTKQIADAEKETAAQAEYDAAVKMGESFLKQNSLQAAKDKYTEASKLKPSESLPKEKLKEIEEKLVGAEAQKEQKKKYDDALAAADVLFGQQDWQGAKDKYEEALSYEGSSSYAKGRKTICEENLAAADAEVAKQEKIQELLDAGNVAMTERDFQAAIDAFDEILTLDSDNTEAKTLLMRASDGLAEEGELAEEEKEFNELVRQGDERETAKSYQEAIDKYEAAIAITPSAEVSQKISETQTKLNEETALAAKTAEFNQLIKEGNQLFADEKLAEAKVKFEKAGVLDPTSDVPPNKIQEIDELLAGEQAESEKQAKYEEFISKANSDFNAENWTEAESNYTEALKFANDRTYAEGQLAKIKTKFGEEEAIAAKKAKYDELIAAANDLFDSGKWADSESKYTEALNFTDDKAYANERIEEIMSKLADEEGIAARQAEYDGLISSADQLYDSESWTEAEEKYKEALGLTDDKTYAEGRINDVQKKIAGNQAAAEKEATYKELVDAGDGLFGQENWNDAQQKFKEALNYTDDNTYAQGKIDEINLKLSELQSSTEQEAKIASLLQEGKNLYTSSDLPAAKSKYEEVLGMDSSNGEALAEIDKINSELALQKGEAQKEEDFNKLKDEGFALAAQKDYSQAKSKLNEALTLKDDAGVKAKIKEIEEAEIAQGELAAKDQEYNQLLTDAAGLGTSGKYTEAISKYREALELKPSEKGPLAKIADLEEKIKNGENQALKDKEYDEIMQRGEELMANSKYLDAIKEFNSALSVKPNEQLPVERAAEAERMSKESTSDFDRQINKNLDIAEKKINEKNYERALGIISNTEKLKPDEPRIKELRDKITLLKRQEEEYNDLMTAADGLASAKDYKAAKSNYEAASKMKPEESLPVEKIEEMRKLIDTQASSAQRDQLYNDYMAKGGEMESTEEYEQALSSYQDALTIREGDVPATNKINEIQQILDNIANTSASDLKKKNDFNALIKKADELFSTTSYPEAKGKYDEALMIFSNDDYAKLQVDECIRLSRLKSNSEEERQYQKVIASADKNFDEENFEKAIMRYETAVSLRSNDPYPKKKLAEIDAILNPQTMAQAQLEDLGTPFSGSILDGTFALAQAEEERKQLNKQAVQKEFNSIYESESQKTAQKTQENYDNSSRIYQTQREIILDQGESDLGRQETIKILRDEEFERKTLGEEASAFEYSENISDQDVLYTINREVELEYGDRSQVYMDNTDVMQNYNAEISALESSKMSTETLDNYRENERISGIKAQVISDQIDDFEERDAVRQEVYDTKKQVTIEFEAISKDNYEEQIETQGVIDDSQKAFTDKLEEGNKSVEENNDELKVIKEGIAERSIVQEEAEVAQLYKADRNMAVVKLEMIADEKERDDERLASIEVYRAGQRSLTEADAINIKKDTEKHLANKAIIEEGVKANGEISEVAEEAHAKKVDYVKTMDKKARVDFEADALSDEEERLAASAGIEKIYSGVSAEAAAEKEKLVESGQALESTKRVIEKASSNRALGEDEKHYDAADKIHSVDDSPGAKVKVANSLGEEYPEGVSQESFTQNDQNGLMKAIITRRIVVIDGHADVYVRTQSINAITYSKNGKPSLSHVWNSETQGPHLERHF